MSTPENDYTPSTEEVRDWAASGFLRFQNYGFQDTVDLDRWLTKRDAATRTAALEEAAVPDAAVEIVARAFFSQTREASSGFTWPINGQWGRDRDMERARNVLVRALAATRAAREVTL